MNGGTERALIEGAAGRIEVAASMLPAPRAVAVIAHPHPLYGGTMDNKVVTTLARAFTEAGASAFRFNFRGVGATEGTHDEGRGETDDCLAVIAHAKRVAGELPLWLAGGRARASNSRISCSWPRRFGASPDRDWALHPIRTIRSSVKKAATRLRIR